MQKIAMQVNGWNKRQKTLLSNDKTVTEAVQKEEKDGDEPGDEGKTIIQVRNWNRCTEGLKTAKLSNSV